MITQIRPDAFDDWLQQVSPRGLPAVLDVREPWELRLAALSPGAFALLAIPMGELPARLHELDRRQPLACLCHHGVRSMQVARYLSHQGFDHIANIVGGIEAWSAQRDPGVPLY